MKRVFEPRTSRAADKKQFELAINIRCQSNWNEKSFLKKCKDFKFSIKLYRFWMCKVQLQNTRCHKTFSFSQPIKNFQLRSSRRRYSTTFYCLESKSFPGEIALQKFPFKSSREKFSNFQRAFNNQAGFLRLTVDLLSSDRFVIGSDFLLNLNLASEKFRQFNYFQLAKFQKISYLRWFSETTIFFWAISWLWWKARSSSWIFLKSFCCWISFMRSLYLSIPDMNLWKFFCVKRFGRN